MERQSFKDDGIVAETTTILSCFENHALSLQNEKQHGRSSKRDERWIREENESILCHSFLLFITLLFDPKKAAMPNREFVIHR
jgi:hypothetical protein